MLEWFWFIIGLWTALAYVAEIYNVIKSFRGKVDYRQYGIDSWALVTAPTDGIGLGFVEFLAKKGFNIVLVGRNPDKLKNLSKTLEESYRVSTKYVVKDFSLAAVNPVPFFTDLKQQTNGLDISIIVNNVGFGRGDCYFTQTSYEEILSQNALNL